MYETSTDCWYRVLINLSSIPFSLASNNIVYTQRYIPNYPRIHVQTISEIYFGFQLIESTRQRCGGILGNCVVVYRMMTILVGPSRVISGIKLDIYWETI